MQILLTNDDGIHATGLESLRRELASLDGVEVKVVAPDSNRSAIGRSITREAPLEVEEVLFEDGSCGYATDGTPVDCVRFAEIIVGQRPDLIVAGINHGANLGANITYSGTVAAALEGVILGVPAVALSQRSLSGDMGYATGEFDFTHAARFGARLVARLRAVPMAPATLINVNFPRGEPCGLEVTRLGEQAQDDRLRLLDEPGRGGRRRYQVYGGKAVREAAEGTDLAVVAAGRIAITPLHFDLTDHEGLDCLRDWRLEEMLSVSAPSE